MEVTVTATKLKIDTDTYVARFDGRDIVKAEAYGGPQPGGSKTQNSWGVRLTLTGDAREAIEGGYFDISFAGGNVTNQPTWVNSKAGADKAVADISVMIRSSSGGGGGGQVDSIVPGDGIDVDATDPVNPIVSVKVDGVTIGFDGLGQLQVPAGGGGYVPVGRQVNTTAPLAGGGDLSANRTLSIPQANGSTDGFLDSADWTTFNNKQPAGNYITALTGDGTASGPGSAALTLATVNSNVGSFGSATQSLTITANAKGLVTAVSAQTVTPAVGSITGLGTGVSTALSNNADTASGFVTQTGGDARYLLASNEIITVLGSTQTTTSATLVDCTGLLLPVDANSNYQVEGFILFQSAVTTNGIWLSVNGPTIGSGVVAINFNIPSSATANQGRNIIAYDGGSATTDVPAANTTYFALMNGIYITGATAGNLQFRFASEGAGTTVRIMQGSSIRLRKVA